MNDASPAVRDLLLKDSRHPARSTFGHTNAQGMGMDGGLGQTGKSLAIGPGDVIIPINALGLAFYACEPRLLQTSPLFHAPGCILFFSLACTHLPGFAKRAPPSWAFM